MRWGVKSRNLTGEKKSLAYTTDVAVVVLDFVLDLVLACRYAVAGLDAYLGGVVGGLHFALFHFLFVLGGR